MRARRNRGFLLVEVLVTVVIVSVAIIFINQAFTAALKAAGLSSDYLCAVLFLEEKSFDFEINPEMQESSLRDESEFMGRGFQWAQEVRPLNRDDMGDEYDEEEASLKRLKLEVGWEARGAERKIDIITYIPEPKLNE